MPFTPAHRIDFHRADDARKWNDQVGGVLVFVFVEGERFRAKHRPEGFPLANTSFGFQAEQIAVVNHSVVVVIGKKGRMLELGRGGELGGVMRGFRAFGKEDGGIRQSSCGGGGSGVGDGAECWGRC